MTTKRQLLKSVRLFCAECNGGPRATQGVWPVKNPKDIEECPAPECIWHKYRFGKDPEVNESRRERGKMIHAQRTQGFSAALKIGTSEYGPSKRTLGKDRGDLDRLTTVKCRVRKCQAKRH